MLDNQTVQNSIVMFQTRWIGACDPSEESNMEQDTVVQSTIDDVLDYLDELPAWAEVDLDEIAPIFNLEDYVDERFEPLVRGLKKELYASASED